VRARGEWRKLTQRKLVASKTVATRACLLLPRRFVLSEPAEREKERERTPSVSGKRASALMSGGSAWRVGGWDAIAGVVHKAASY